MVTKTLTKMGSKNISVINNDFFEGETINKCTIVKTNKEFVVVTINDSDNSKYKVKWNYKLKRWEFLE